MLATEKMHLGVVKDAYKIKYMKYVQKNHPYVQTLNLKPSTVLPYSPNIQGVHKTAPYFHLFLKLQLVILFTFITIQE